MQIKNQPNVKELSDGVTDYDKLFFLYNKFVHNLSEECKEKEADLNNFGKQYFDWKR